jgi:predicted amidophosphoribosyltransferase
MQQFNNKCGARQQLVPVWERSVSCFKYSRCIREIIKSAKMRLRRTACAKVMQDAAKIKFERVLHIYHTACAPNEHSKEIRER